MDNSKEPTRNLLLFQLSGLNWALPLESVREIVPMARLSCPPNLPSGLAGFLDLRGTAIPILRLDRLCDLAEQLPGLHTPMIVLRGVAGPVGILAEAVYGILPLRNLQFLEIPENGTFHACASATLQLDGKQTHLLSPTALLQANEDRLIANYAAMEQARLLHFEART